MNLHRTNLIEEIERSLSNTLGENIKIFSSDALGGGCINHASRIDTSAGPFFIKWNSDDTTDIFLREAESLNELRKAAGDMVKVPEVYASKVVDNTPGYLVLEYLTPGAYGSDVDEKLGRGLAFIHQYTNSKFGFYHNNFCGSTPQNNAWEKDWVLFFRDNRLRFLLNLIRKRRPLPLNEEKVYEDLLHKIHQIIPGNSEPVLIHGDLWSGNYMTTAEGAALIDPAAYFADREMEFSIMTMFGGFSSRFYAAYNEINPLPVGWMERNKLYQIYHVLNHYYLFGGGYRAQAFSIARSFV